MHGGESGGGESSQRDGCPASAACAVNSRTPIRELAAVRRNRNQTMNEPLRDHAPISTDAWKEIDTEALPPP